MFARVTRRLFPVSAKSVPAPRTARLGLDAFEERVVPAAVSFANGVLNVQADPATNDYVRVTAAGANRDGSTGVKVLTNVTGTWTTQTFGDAAHPVTNVALDMRDGNDFVDIASLRAAVVLVGEGNGNNVVAIGDTKSGGLITGSGRNLVSVGSGTADGFGSFNLPGAASSVAFVGWGYQIVNGGTGIYLNGNTGNAHNNVVHMGSVAGSRSFVDLVGTGNNLIATGAGDDGVSVIGGGNNLIATGRGNDLVLINGSGNNAVCTGSGDDHVTITGGGNNEVHAGAGANTVSISGNGNNRVSADGAGSIAVTGSGKNAVRTGKGATTSVALNGAGAGSTITASHLGGVLVDGAAVTASGVVGNVTVKLI